MGKERKWQIGGTAPASHRRARISASSVFVKYLSRRGGHYLLSTGALFDLGRTEIRGDRTASPPRLLRSQSGRSKMSESRRGRERSDLKSATMPVLTGKEEVFVRRCPRGPFYGALVRRHGSRGGQRNGSGLGD